MQQHVNLFSLQQILRIELVDNTVRDALLIYLSVVNILLHRVVGDEPIDKTAPSLAVAVDATDGLAVMAWVPRSIKHYDATCSDQVYTKTPSPATVSHTQATMAAWTLDSKQNATEYT